MRIGHGYDVHKLVEGRPLILGGVTIPFEKGLLGGTAMRMCCFTPSLTPCWARRRWVTLATCFRIQMTAGKGRTA